MTRIHALYIAAISCAALVPPIAAQGQGPAFEAVSIKVNRSGDSRSSFRGNLSGISVTNQTMTDIIRNVWGVNRLQIVGGPSWIGEDRFDIEAKASGKASRDELVAMMKTMLADRFKLTVHRETREMDIYALVMARADGKPGPAMKPSTQDCEAMMDAARRGTLPPPPGPNDPVTCGTRGTTGRIQVGGMPLVSFANMLSGRVQRTVVDRTGLVGAWDFEITFAPDSAPIAAPPGVELPAGDPTAPSLFTAIQEQLGLKLQSTKGPVEVLVVDSIEHPTSD